MLIHICDISYYSRGLNYSFAYRRMQTRGCVHCFISVAYRLFYAHFLPSVVSCFMQNKIKTHLACSQKKNKCSFTKINFILIWKEVMSYILHIYISRYKLRTHLYMDIFLTSSLLAPMRN